MNRSLPASVADYVGKIPVPDVRPERDSLTAPPAA